MSSAQPEQVEHPSTDGSLAPYFSAATAAASAVAQRLSSIARGETNPHSVRGETGADVDVNQLIEEQKWPAVAAALHQYPEEARVMLNSEQGWTKLHTLCFIGSTPSSLVELAASMDPDAITQPDARYGDTPLHSACRNAQVTTGKVFSLLRFIPRDQRARILIRNLFGVTVLHAAAAHNAALPVLHELIRVQPRLINLTTTDGIHPVSALYTSYIQTIPGTMAVANALKGRNMLQNDGHFKRFWDKVVFLSTASRLDRLPGAPGDRSAILENDESSPSHQFVLHGLLESNVLLNCYKLALTINPTLASVADPATGNLPLHSLVVRRPYRLGELNALRMTLDAYPNAADVLNARGEWPLILALQQKLPSEAITVIVDAGSDESLSRRDPRTGLLPFQLAATTTNRHADSLSTVFQILLAQPSLLGG